MTDKQHIQRLHELLGIVLKGLEAQPFAWGNGQRQALTSLLKEAGICAHKATPNVNSSFLQLSTDTTPSPERETDSGNRITDSANRKFSVTVGAEVIAPTSREYRY